MKNDFEQRRERSRAHAEKMALKMEKESQRLYEKSRDMASVIPMEQPILVGHHSEKSDRRYREKIHNTMGKSVEAEGKAAYYARKAEAIESNDAIFSDDPQAEKKLEEKIRGLKANQEFMKQANRCIKKGDREGFLKLDLASEKLWAELIKPSIYGKGFAGFSLTNNQANIRRLEKRLAAIKALAEKETSELVLEGVRVLENPEANRVQLFFEGKPEAEVIAQLKGHSFWWSPSQSAWQRHLSPSAVYWAKAIAKGITG